MIQEYLLQLLLIAAGLLLFLRTVCSLARKELTESFSMFWSVVAILLVVAGAVLFALDWQQYITPGALIVVAAVFVLMIEELFFLSQQLSLTIRKTRELAMQISLLNQEHLKVDQYLADLSGQSRHQIWRTNTVAEAAEPQAKKEETHHEECTVCH